MYDLLDIYLLGSDTLEAIGTQQAEKMDAVQAMLRQQRMTEAAVRAAHTLSGIFGMRLLQTVEDKKREMEDRHGFPLQLQPKDREKA